MSSVIGKLFGGGANGGSMGYDKAKQLAGGNSKRQRRKLAERTDIQPEILYYLADDPEPEVRRAIAANGTTPPQADLILARDRDDLVRCNLAQKIARLAPELSPDEQNRVSEMVAEVLETLARDALPRVRRILAEELKDADNVPHAVVRRLACDDDAEVAAPGLEFSPLLNDDVLLEIIASRPVQGALSAISRRSGLGMEVADAIAGADDEEAIAALLSNTSAQIREETLDSLVDRAEATVSWHAPLVRRPSLSLRAIKRLSEFVAETLIIELTARNDIDAETARTVGAAVRDRIKHVPAAQPAGDDGDDAGTTPEERAGRLHAEGKLDEQMILDGLGKGDRSFVSAALAVLAALPPDVVQKIASMQSAKGVTALAWKAGLGMRAAVQLQLRLARIAPAKILHPKNGVDFPLSAEEMTWQLEFFAG
jgi:uncharacterized protein (DUF2336 family)